MNMNAFIVQGGTPIDPIFRPVKVLILDFILHPSVYIFVNLRYVTILKVSIVWYTENHACSLTNCKYIT